MEDYSIIQGQTMLEAMYALLLTLITSYVYFSRWAYAQRMRAPHVARLKTPGPESADHLPSVSPSPAIAVGEMQILAE